MLESKNPVLSIVSPVFNAEECLDELIFRITKSVQEIDVSYEILLIDDWSTDGSWRKIEEIASANSSVKGIRLSRNFGQHYAITAGLEHSTGEWIVVMDCDLQDKPEEIIKFYKIKSEGFDVVFGRRINRKDTFIKKLFSRFFYKLFNMLTENLSDRTVSNFGIYSRQVIQNYLKLTEKIRLFPLLIRWMGFKIGFIDIEHSKRTSGISSYNFSKLFNLAINAIVSQTNKPLKISIKYGFFMSIFSLLFLIYLIIRRLLFDIPLGWTSIMVSIFFVGGLIFANLGLIGLYIGKIYDETKNRPIYIVKEFTCDLKSKRNV